MQLKIAVIAISALVIFFQDIYVTGSEALASDYFNYVLVIPFFMAYLVYRKRQFLSAALTLKDDKRSRQTNLLVGLCALTSSFVVYLYGSDTSSPLDYHLIALQIFFGASILMTFNRQVLKVLLVPILLTNAALPSVVQFGLGLWLDMSWLSTIPSFQVLKLFGLPVSFTTTLDAPTIVLATSGGQSTSFVVAVASSGIYSVVGFSLFAAFIAYIMGGSAFRRILLFSFAFPLLLAVNIIRLILLVAAANWFSSAAVDAYHLTSGIALVFIVTLALLAVGDRFFKLRIPVSTSKQGYCSYCSGDFKTGHNFCTNCGRFLRSRGGSFVQKDVLAILALILVVIIFASSLVPAVAFANSPTDVNLTTLTSQSALSLLPQVPGWTLSFSYRDTSIEQALKQDASLVFAYTSLNASANGNKETIFAFVQISATIHSPEASLITFPESFGYPQAKSLIDEDVQILGNPPLVGRLFVYQRASLSQPEAIMYWNVRSVFNFGSYSDYRNVQLSVYDTLPLLIASGVVKNNTDFPGIEQAFLPLARSIAQYWQPISSESTLLAVTGRWYGLMLGVPIFFGGVVVGKDALDERKETRLNRRFYEKLSAQSDKDILKSLSVAKESTVEQIVVALKKLDGREMPPQDVNHVLENAKRVGLVKQRIADKSEGPRLVWEDMTLKARKILRFSMRPISKNFRADPA